LRASNARPTVLNRQLSPPDLNNSRNLLWAR
jgi:hypothetical protein